MGRRLREKDEFLAAKVQEEIAVVPADLAVFVSAAITVEHAVRQVKLRLAAVQFTDPDVAEADGIAVVLERDRQLLRVRGVSAPDQPVGLADQRRRCSG